MSTVKSIAKKTPRYEVLSVRLNEERLALLERYRDSLAGELGRPVTIAEAAFLVIEDRAAGMDRAASRYELLLDQRHRSIASGDDGPSNTRSRRRNGMSS